MKRRFILTVSSALGLGYAPVAPGTFGTLAALPIWWAASGLSLTGFVLVTVVVTVAAVVVSELAERIYGSHDVQRIVIDEVAGMLVTVIGVPFRWPEVLAAFALFRLLDATKPPPIRWFDRHVKGGFGVVLDDVVAGAIACALLHGARLVLGGWW
ncbi:MAG: phosphatidylglycerophosphatase A [Myxococcota bacterium]